MHLLRRGREGGRRPGAALSLLAVVGSLNCDVVVRVDELPRPGETVLGRDLRWLPGGKGGNQAVAAARLGAQVRLAGAVGDDPTGADLIRWQREEGVDTAFVQRIEGPSGAAFIDVRPDGENLITVAPGANHALTSIDPRVLTGVDAVVLQLELPYDVVGTTARLARRDGTRVVLNAAPLTDPGGVRELAGEADVLVVNEGEANALGANGPGDLLRLGPGLAVMTLGRRGAMWAASIGGNMRTENLVPGFRVEAVDAVGAGDTFTAALTIGLAAGQGPGEAVRTACAAAALATTKPGAQTAMPTAAELADFLAR